MQAGFRRYGWLAAIAVAYLYIVPYFPKIHSANELPRVYLVKAIVEDHAFYVDTGAAKWGATADVSPYGGHQYSNKAPGASLLAVPVYAVADAIARAAGGDLSLHASLWLCRIVSGVAPTLAFLWLLWGFLARFAPDPDLRRLVVIAYALGSLVFTYSILFYSHQLAASAICGAWIVALDVAEGRRRPRAMLVAGVLAGCAPLMDYQGVFAALPVAIHILVKLPRGQRLRGVGLAVVGAAPPIALLLVYHALCFGSPWRTGYDASTTFAMYHQHGFLGITALRSEAFWGSLFRIDNGLVALSPWVVLAVPGFISLWRSGERAVALTCAGVAVVYVLFISSINFWRGGWGVGPRYITEVVPFLLPPVAAQLQRWAEAPRRLGVAAGLIGVGVVIYVLSSATFPYWPDSVRHPLVDVTFRLVADNLVADNLGSALGVPGLAGLIPYFAATFGLLGWTVWRRGRVTAIVAVAVTAAVLVTYGQLPHGEPRADSAYRYVRAAVLDL